MSGSLRTPPRPRRRPHDSSKVSALLTREVSASRADSLPGRHEQEESQPIGCNLSVRPASTTSTGMLRHSQRFLMEMTFPLSPRGSSCRRRGGG